MNVAGRSSIRQALGGRVRAQGFALVVTISLLVLPLVVEVAC